MAKKQAPADPLKAKEARQKKIAIGGAVVLVIVLVIQGPKLMKQMGHSSAPPPAPATTAAAPGTPAPAGVTTPLPTGSTVPSSGGLLSASAPTAGIGQLSSFGSFVSKDPFASQTPSNASATAKQPGRKGSAPTPPATPPTPPSPPSGGSSGPAANPASAVISVNGVKESVAVGGDFPAQQPFFHLVSLTQNTARISIAGGSLADGSPTLTLHVGKPVTLQNTTDGTRYTIVLWPQGTTVPAAGAATTTSSGGSTTTTTTASTPTTTPNP